MPVRIGGQRPTFTTAPDDVTGIGDEAVRLFEAYGVKFYDAQAYELRLMMARTEYKDFAAKAIYISKPRQNGKSFAARFYCIYCAAVLGLKVLYTAHRVRTAREMFKAISEFVQAHRDFRRALVYPQGIYKAPGFEGVYFTAPDGRPGGCIEFITRGAGSRGLTASVVVVDEAQEMTEAEAESLLPTTVAGAEASRALSQQVIYLGTPPDEKTRGTVFRDAHDKAHAGILYGSWWLEWAAEKVVEPGDDAAAIEAMYATNPALGHRIREDVLLGFYHSMSAEGFAREHLGYWSEYRSAALVVDPDAWDACGSKEPAPQGLRVYAVKFEHGGAYASLAVAVRPAEGPPRIELAGHYDTAHGLGALVDDLLKAAPKASEIVADGAGYAQTLLERLMLRGVPRLKLHRPSTLEVTTAASNLVSMVAEGAVTHYDAPGQALLDDSAKKTTRRQVGRSGGYSFASTEEAYAEPIEAAALALLYVLKTKRDPTRKARIL